MAEMPEPPRGRSVGTVCRHSREQALYAAKIEELLFSDHDALDAGVDPEERVYACGAVCLCRIPDLLFCFGIDHDIAYR